MAYVSLAVETPNATAYDAEYPTRSTELYSHNLHEIMQDMEDVTGSWFLTDHTPTSAQVALLQAWQHDVIEVVFDYAASAIEEHRAEDPITLAAPADNEFSAFGYWMYPEVFAAMLRLQEKAYSMMYKIYYMWKTEEDPLLLKEKLQELLIAWPLTDSEVILSEDSGASIRIVPAWKNVDL